MTADTKSWRLIRRSPSKANGRRNEANVWDDHSLIAQVAAIECGYIAGGGITDALPPKLRKRARKLLVSNEPRLVSGKTRSRDEQLRARVRNLVLEALPLIGPLYLRTEGRRGAAALSRKLLADWLFRELGNPTSPASKRLLERREHGKFQDLIDNPRAWDWWYRRLKPG